MALSRPHNPHQAERAIVLIPICNPGNRWSDFLQALQGQTVRPVKVVVLDSESSDGSPQAAQSLGYTVQPIQRARFSHGGTRQQGLEQYAQDYDFAIYLTQDAILAEPLALERLLDAFDDQSVAAVYGRQLPHADATPIAAHARLFNYPPDSHTVTLQDRAQMGLKTCFLSNSFAAYRLSALRSAGGFADHLILGEDMHLAARLLLAGHAIRYQASASVHHSHNYNSKEEFGRYFDAGVFHAQQPWLRQTFGHAGKEGLKYMTSEMRYLWRTARGQMPQALVRSLLKLIGFKWGQFSQHQPQWLNRRLSMHKGYWV